MRVMGSSDPSLRRGTTQARKPAGKPVAIESAICWLAPVLAALGSLFFSVSTPVGEIFGFRFLVIAIVGVGFVSVGHRNGHLRLHPIAGQYVLLGLVWLGWGLALILARDPDASGAMQELLVILFGFLIGFGFLLLDVGRKNRCLQWLRRGWVSAYVIAGAVAVWELMTGDHVMSTPETARADLYPGVTIFSTFNNPNDYAAFIALAVPFLAWSAAKERGAWRLVYWGLLGSAPLLALLQKSVIAPTAIAAEIVIGFLLVGRKKPRVVFGLALMIVTGTLAWAALSPGLSTAGDQFGRVTAGGFGGGGSPSERLNLVRNGLWFTHQSNFVGTGPASFENQWTTKSPPHDTGSARSPHFFWVEVLSQYGVVVFLLLVWWMLRLFASTRPTSYKGLVVRTGVVGFAIAATASSSYIRGSIQWVFLASLLVLAVADLLDQEVQDESP